MKIVLVEDDRYQREESGTAILERYPDAVIQTIRTESQFLGTLETFTERPDIFLIDIMLRWADPSPDMPPMTPNAIFLEAGFRCAAELQKVMPGVPTVLYTTLDVQDIQGKRETLPPEVRYVRKSSDFRPLYEAIAQLTQQAGRA